MKNKINALAISLLLSIPSIGFTMMTEEKLQKLVQDADSVMNAADTARTNIELYEQAITRINATKNLYMTARSIAFNKSSDNPAEQLIFNEDIKTSNKIISAITERFMLANADLTSAKKLAEQLAIKASQAVAAAEQARMDRDEQLRSAASQSSAAVQNAQAATKIS